jgi:hypothetical protein
MRKEKNEMDNVFSKNTKPNIKFTSFHFCLQDGDIQCTYTTVHPTICPTGILLLYLLPYFCYVAKI